MIVIDASVFLDACSNKQVSQNLVVVSQSRKLIAPNHFDAECLHGLRKLERLGILQTEQAEEFVDLLPGLNCIRYSVLPLVKEIWKLRHNMTAYDASYVALAFANQCEIITHDKKLARAIGSAIKSIRLD